MEKTPEEFAEAASNVGIVEMLDIFKTIYDDRFEEELEIIYSWSAATVVSGIAERMEAFRKALDENFERKYIQIKELIELGVLS